MTDRFYARVAFSGYIIIEVAEPGAEDVQYASDTVKDIAEVFHAAAGVHPMVHESGFNIMDARVVEHTCQHESEV